MIDIKPGDWVLAEHPYLYDTYIVRKVHSATKSMVSLVKVERDGVVLAERRKRKCVVGVFPGENAAKSAAVAINELSTQRMAEERALKAKFRTAHLALLNPEGTPE